MLPSLPASQLYAATDDEQLSTQLLCVQHICMHARLAARCHGLDLVHEQRAVNF